MFSDIARTQNTAENLALLKASIVAYKSAKSGEIWITYIFLVLSIGFPTAYILTEGEPFKYVLYAASLIIAFVAEATTGYFRGNTAKGALIKELFDTSVFKLRWKSSLPKPIPGEIQDLSNKYTGDDVRDWYSTRLSKHIEHNASVAILQYSNTIWDIELRKRFRNSVRFYIIVWASVVMIASYCSGISGVTFFLMCYSLHPVFSHFFSMQRGHSEVIDKRKEISDALWEVIQSKRDINEVELRDFQDEIYITRQSAAKVPDFFFLLFKKRLNNLIEETIAKINHLYDPGRS